MECPDCGKIIAPVPLGMHGEATESYRCYSCGGFWLNSWLANRINAKMLDKFPGTGAMHGVAHNGDGNCPVHRYRKLDRYSGDSVPQHLSVYRCGECGWWWFPKNSLFDYKPAQEAKVNYFRLWGMPAEVKGLLLPVAVLAVLIGGGLVTLKLVKQQQYALLNASGVVSDVSLTYLGNGEALIVFRSEVLLSHIEYRNVKDMDWTEVAVESEGGFYNFQMTNLAEGEEYEFKILGKTYNLKSY